MAFRAATSRDVDDRRWGIADRGALVAIRYDAVEVWAVLEDVLIESSGRPPTFAALACRVPEPRLVAS
jgi:hypothetical protein